MHILDNLAQFRLVKADLSGIKAGQRKLYNFIVYLKRTYAAIYRLI